MNNEGEAFYQENTVHQLELHFIKSEHSNQWLEIAESENKKPFNCETGPLIRFLYSTLRLVLIFWLYVIIY